MSERKLSPLTRYRMFHGKSRAPLVRTNFHNPNTLIFLGQAVSIVYLSNKKSGGGDGTLCEYEHEFETPVNLYMDETGKRQLYLIGEKLTVTRHGIEN